eukprot:CAMPEP_0118881624 /NCGR_PEP_ID=MMETSP1163-20130328/21042_1 /TAXON_ID=124430 /ORGANISM="Phaeomonas parva, Strain CCMP2877" /LENGTH=61 /DNA_ID=CAMNT_0006818443 /DNA_START=372 /DNA_END=554 /DNA_ORIENTATION=-
MAMDTTSETLKASSTPVPRAFSPLPLRPLPPPSARSRSCASSTAAEAASYWLMRSHTPKRH